MALSTLVRQMADALGLTTPGLRANRWKIEDPPPEVESGDNPTRQRARDRLRVVAVDPAEIDQVEPHPYDVWRDG